jgi:hypothetical protein
MRLLFLLLVLFFVAGCSAQEEAPSEEQIKNAASQSYLKINEDVRAIADECRGKGGIIVNPLTAMKCTAICSFDPQNCEKLPILEITDFKKLACEKATGQSGWICDYQYSVKTDSQFLMDMFTGIYGDKNQAQARFFKTDAGAWVMTPIER